MLNPIRKYAFLAKTLLFTSQESLNKSSPFGARRGSLGAAFKGKPVDSLRGRVWGSWRCLSVREAKGGPGRLLRRLSAQLAVGVCLHRLAWAAAWAGEGGEIGAGAEPGQGTAGGRTSWRPSQGGSAGGKGASGPMPAEGAGPGSLPPSPPTHGLPASSSTRGAQVVILRGLGALDERFSWPWKHALLAASLCRCVASVVRARVNFLCSIVAVQNFSFLKIVEKANLRIMDTVLHVGVASYRVFVVLSEF